jgi:hypothetical protein
VSIAHWGFEIRKNNHLMKRGADAVKHRVLAFAAAGVGELKRRIHEQLVGQLLVGHTPGKRGVHTAAAAALAGWNGWAAVLARLVELRESVDPPNLLELGTQALDLCSELDLELGIVGLVMREVLPGLIESNKSVLDAADELCLVWHLPRLELLQVLEQDGRE